MAKNKTGNFRIHSGVSFAALLAITVLVTSCGSSTVSTTVNQVSAPTPGITPAQPAISSITTKVSSIVSTPYLTGSTIRYLSDCQTGNATPLASGCVQGNDTLDGTSATISGSHGPWQTLEHGAAWLNSQTSGTYTLAMARGGVWNVAANSATNFLIDLSANKYCAAGQTCSEVREYPLGGTDPKPVIYGPNQANSNLFFPGNGQRIMNLTLIGTTPATGRSVAFFLYSNLSVVHDDSILNVDISGFDYAIMEGQPHNYNMTIEGNHIFNNYDQGYLGGSNNLNLNYNSFIDNGGLAPGTSLALHSIYIASHEAIEGVNAIGNYVTGYYKGTGATQCTSGQFVLHGAITNLVVSGNTVINDSNAAAGCWGLSANLITAAPYGGYFRNALFSDNIIVNGGNSALNVENCPGCMIENNLIIADNPTATDGISAPPYAARTSIANCTPSTISPIVQCYDDPSTNYTIRNNTVYFTANANTGMVGIQVGVAGSSETQTGHQIYNNTVSYMANTANNNGSTNGFNQVYCFDFPLATSAYAYKTISNNNCYVPSSKTLNYAWEQTTGKSLADWQASTLFDANSSISNLGFSLSATPYITWSDSSLAANLFNNGSTNIFSPASTFAGNGIIGPSTDITGASRPTTAPSIGAYQ